MEEKNTNVKDEEEKMNGLFWLKVIVAITYIIFIILLFRARTYNEIFIIFVGIALSLGIVAYNVICYDRNENNKNKNILRIYISILLIAGIEIYTITSYDPNPEICSARDQMAKPIIYLYPEEDTEVTVTLGYPDSITASYPTYVVGWNVLAKADGTLIDLDTDRSLYSLYYESENNIEFEIEDEGFVVKGEDTAEFLEEKLEILGLNEREAEEFIIYWLPVLQENEYNYIRFANEEEIEENMPLTISPEPDTLIRVLMTYKGLDEKIEVEEQELESVQRSGFVAVEWGGTEIR